MNKNSTNQTLDIDGTINTYKAVRWNVAFAVAFVGLGICLWLQIGTSWIAPADVNVFVCRGFAVTSFIIAAFLTLPSYGHTYLDFTGRQIVTLNYSLFGTNKRCRPLTDFRKIVVRHLCHPGGEGPDTYTGSVGLKPVDGRAVLWVKSFPTTQDEVPRTAYEFARMLQEMTGLPGAPGGEFKNETQ